MTESEARGVLLLQAHESLLPRGAAPAPGAVPAAWSAEDRRWATRQALAGVGEGAVPERFVLARTALALPRLLARDAEGAAWLQRRGWHPAWVAGAVVLGLAAGLAADQLGPPDRVNLLAPAVWAVVTWNLIVYLALGLPGSPMAGVRSWLARGIAGWRGAGPGTTMQAEALWWQHAAPLMARRSALVLHAAAAALALGLAAGLYMRGLVLDYRAGWQSTFLEAGTVQQLLGWLLAPAAALSGVALPDVAPLRLAPGQAATASAAPWIHLYATTLALAVVLPRLALAALAARGAARLALRFPLALDTPYFEALHPLMRPGTVRTVRLGWLPAGREVVLFGRGPGAPGTPQLLLESEEGDQLLRVPLPPAGDDPARLRREADAVLLVASPDEPRPEWLASLGLPIVWLRDERPLASGPPQAPSPREFAHAAAHDAEHEAAHEAAAPLYLADRDEGWLREGRLLRALAEALPDDPRLSRLQAAWADSERRRVEDAVAAAAEVLARAATASETVAEAGLLARREAAEAARSRLLERLLADLRGLEDRLLAAAGRQAVLDSALVVPDGGTGAAAGSGALAATLRTRVGEGRAALVGGVLTGALAGLKADLATGGLTLGAGALAGGLVGAVGAAGAARGLNVVRGTERSHAGWDDAALALVTRQVLSLLIEQGHGRPARAVRAPLAAALDARAGTFQTLWRSARPGSSGGPLSEQALAAALAAPVAETLHAVLGGPPLRA